MIEWWETYHGTIGSAHGVSGDGKERDVVERLRETVEEVTRKPLPKPPERRIGFLPWSQQ